MKDEDTLETLRPSSDKMFHDGKFFWGILIVYCLILPEQWESVFYPLSLPQSWLADQIPALIKLQNASTFPGVMRGAYSFVWIWIVVWAVWLAIFGSVRRRVKYAVRKFSWWYILRYFLGIVFLTFVFFIVFFYAPLIDIDRSNHSTRAHALMSLILSNRLVLGFGLSCMGTTFAILLFFIYSFFYIFIYCIIVKLVKN